MSSMRDLLVDQVRDLYDAEHQIVDGLPKMIDKASNSDLRDALQHHLDETRGQVERLEKVFDELDESPKRKACKGMKGIMKENEEALEEAVDGARKDVLIIAGAQRVEHYEMAGYGTAAAWADELGLGDVADLLGETLDEEEDADAKLSSIATGGIISEGVNEKAAQRV